MISESKIRQREGVGGVLVMTFHIFQQKVPLLKKISSTTMNTILVPTDFSDTSGYAFETAVSIARKAGASIHLLHVIENADYPDITDITLFRLAGTTSVLQAIENRLQEISCSELCSDLQVTWSVDYDSPSDKIISSTVEGRFDLVVIGSQGNKGIERPLPGSTARKVMRRSCRPVLTVREQSACFSPLDIVFSPALTVNDSPHHSWFRQFASRYGATLHLLKVNTRQHFETTSSSRLHLEQFASRERLPNYTINIVNDHSEAEGILGFTADKNAGLVCITTHHTSGLSHPLLHGNLSEHLSAKAPCPTLHLNPEPRGRPELWGRS